LGALAVRQWLPLAVSFVPAKHLFKSFDDTWVHLQNLRLLAVSGMGFTVLFALVGVFIYVSFYLARTPFNLGPAALGSVFFVYLLGCVVTPLAGRFLDLHGFWRMVMLSVGMSIIGLLLTLAPYAPVVITGLAVFSSGPFYIAIGCDCADRSGGETRPFRRRWDLRDLLLHWRDSGHCGNGVVLTERRVAHLCRFVCHGQPSQIRI
jgi:hypothetical protein